MKDVDSLHGQALALSNIAKTYEYMADISRACETLETVSPEQEQHQCSMHELCCNIILESVKPSHGLNSCGYTKL